MELFLVKELLIGVAKGKKDLIVSCLILLVAYRFYKLVKFTFFELKKRDIRIDELEKRINEMEEKK